MFKNIRAVAFLALLLPFSAEAQHAGGGMLPNASNATLPDARNNLGIGKGGPIAQFWADDYGADRTGAADSGAAALAAYTAAVAWGGGEIVFGRGSYKFDSFPAIIVDGLTIRGAGRSATVLRPNFATGDFLSLSAFGSAAKALAVKDLTITPLVTRTSGALIHVAGAAWSTIDGVDLNDGYNGIQIDNYGIQAQVYVSNVRAIGASNVCLDFGSDSTVVVNEVFLNNITTAQCGAGMSFSFASGIYGTAISNYQSSGQGIQFIPLLAQTKHAIGPFDQAVYGVVLSQAQADAGANSGFFFGGTGKIAQVSCDNCLAASNAASGWTIATDSVVNDVSFSNFHVSLSGTSGINWASLNAKNVALNGGRICNNNTTENAGGMGIVVGVANTGGWSITNTTSGLCGYDAAVGNTNKQKYGYFIVAGNDPYVFSNNRAPSNVTGTVSNASSGAADKIYVAPTQ